MSTKIVLFSDLHEHAVFSPRGVQPVCAGKLPKGVDALIRRVVNEQQLTLQAAITGDYELAFEAFVHSGNMAIPSKKRVSSLTKCSKTPRSTFPFMINM